MPRWDNVNDRYVVVEDAKRKSLGLVEITYSEVDIVRRAIAGFGSSLPVGYRLREYQDAYVLADICHVVWRTRLPLPSIAHQSYYQRGRHGQAAGPCRRALDLCLWQGFFLELFYYDDEALTLILSIEFVLDNYLHTNTRAVRRSL